MRQKTSVYKKCRISCVDVILIFLCFKVDTNLLFGNLLLLLHACT